MARKLFKQSVIGPALVAGLGVALVVPGSSPVGERAEAAPGGAGDRVSARFALDGPRGIKVLRNRRYMPFGPTLDVYRQVGLARPAPAVLVVHGGGWAGGGKARMAATARAIARAGMVALNVGYTLAEPGWAAGYPRQPDQLRAAVRWTRRSAARLGVDRRRIGAIGSSAGGHLAALLATTGRGRLDAGARIAAAVSWSAPFDLPALAHHRMLGTAATALLGCPADDCLARWEEASPLTWVTPDDPPLLLVNSRHEMVPATQVEQMAERLGAARVPHELWLLDGHEHGREYADRVLPRSVAFLREQLLP